MPESVHEQVAASLKARLSEIVSDGGARRWYTPTAVLRCQDYPSTFDASRDLVLYLRANTYQLAEGTTGRVNGTAPFSVLIVKRYERSSTRPEDEAASEDDSGPTIVSRCVADVVAALLYEVSLGGLVWNVAQADIEVDPAFVIAGAWLGAELNFSVRYDYLAEREP